MPILAINYANDPIFNKPYGLLEDLYNRLSKLLLGVSMIIMAFLPFPVAVDIIGRSFFHYSLVFVSELETMGLVVITFCAMPYVTARGEHIVIDMLYNALPQHGKHFCALLVNILSMVICFMLSKAMIKVALETKSLTPVLYIPEGIMLGLCAASLILVAFGMVWQALHTIEEMIKGKEWLNFLLVAILVCFIFAIPTLYKYYHISLDKLTLGSIGFVFLFALLFMRMPIGFGMALVGVIGLLAISKRSAAAWSLVAETPYKEIANFVFVAVPMFMLMGEVCSASSISRDMFECFNKWMGKLPGGLAIASVGGCAGFGAICGDSMCTVITMSSVALPPMRSNNYAPSLSCGALAAGGTLGILIPPSMGFVYYSIMTEESIGKLFVAGIMPGLLLTAIFMAIIIFQVKRNPSLAPKGPSYPLGEKLKSLVGIIPMVLLFLLVVGGILNGWFTPGEGGAVGALVGFFYALCRRQISWEALVRVLKNTALMSGKVFVILVGVYVFGCFLASSRMPALLAQFVAGLQVNKYVIIAVIVAIYIILGCVMNIVPMMLLTLPSIYPTVQAMNIDGIWFGVITVIVMEMGMITPPIGLNVFTMSSLAPDITMSTIFKGVLPFFVGMIICVILVIMFPQIALWLPSTL